MYNLERLSSNREYMEMVVSVVQEDRLFKFGKAAERRTKKPTKPKIGTALKKMSKDELLGLLERINEL